MTTDSRVIWNVRQLRMTVFPEPGTELAPNDWWLAAVQEEPETQLSRAREGLQQIEGPYLGGRLVLQTQPIRINWQLDPDPEQRQLEGLPHVGALRVVVPSFQAMAARWFSLESCPTVLRLAFGAVLSFGVENRADGYRRLAPFLPAVTLDPDGSSDFHYQINRRRKSTSGIQELQINRLSKWSVEAFQTAIFAIAPPGEAFGQASIPGPPLFSLHLELDVNTVPDPQIRLTRDNMPAVFSELISLGLEITERGDLP